MYLPLGPKSSFLQVMFQVVDYYLHGGGTSEKLLHLQKFDLC